MGCAVSLALCSRIRRNHLAASDPFFSSVASLLHCDGSNGGTTFTDQIGRAWTSAGAVTATAQKKYGTASMDCRSPGYITTASHADFDFGTGDFTIEWWEHVASLVTYETPYSRGYISSGGLLVQSGNGDGQYNVYMSGSLICSESTPKTLSIWQHHALVRSGSTVLLFRDGVQTASGTGATNIVNANVCSIGSDGAHNFPVNGYLDDIRITKGVARYTAGFTPPVAPFPNS